MVRAVLAVLVSLLGTALAQGSFSLSSLTYTTSYIPGPSFDPSNAPFFGPSAIVYPSVSDTIPTLSNGVPMTTQTPTFIRSRVSSAVSSGAASSQSAQSSASASRSVAVSVSSSAAGVSSNSVVSRAPSMSTNAARTSSVTRTSTASVAAQSTGAAVVNVAGVVGAIAGGLFAGVAML
jgi:hypothetical protein